MRRLAGFLIAIALMLTPAQAGSLIEGIDAVLNGDYPTALQIFRPLAEQGDALAQFSLGLMYESGQGVPQDYGEAVKWFRRAAEQGNATAQVSLGLAYILGNGVPQDFVLGHMWLNLSAANGYSDAVRMRDKLAQSMTAEQIAEAQRLAREWKPGAQ